MTNNIGKIFQNETSHKSGRAARPVVIPGKVSVNLPEPPPIEASLFETLKSRRSKRNFSNEPISLNELSALLWACQGVNEAKGELALRTAPSAGATYALETYVIAQNINALDQGLYHFDPITFSLRQKTAADLKQAAAEALLDQRFVAKAAVVIIWTAVIERCRRRYGERAYRYVYLDCGHAVQNLLLMAAALNLSACPVGAFYDDMANDLLGIDGTDEISLYAAVAGKEGQPMKPSRRANRQ